MTAQASIPARFSIRWSSTPHDARAADRCEQFIGAVSIRETDDSCTLSVVVLGDQIIRHLELGKAVVGAQFFHIRMRIGVVSKLTADRRHARDHICTVFFHIAAEHKERRLCPVLLQAE